MLSVFNILDYVIMHFHYIFTVNLYYFFFTISLMYSLPLQENKK